jgi:hypothetical protein
MMPNSDLMLAALIEAWGGGHKGRIFFGDAWHELTPDSIKAQNEWGEWITLRQAIAAYDECQEEERE